MIIKFALGDSSFKLFENVSDLFYKKEIWLPKKLGKLQL